MTKAVHRTTFFAVSLLTAAAISACGRVAPPPLISIGVPDLTNEHVSAASDGRSLVALAWAASSEAAGTNIFAAVSDDSGKSFATPVRVNATDGQARVNGEQPPRIAIERVPRGGTAIVVLWTAPGGEGTSLLFARSTDGGRSFGPTTPLPSVDAPGNRGWEALAATSSGKAYALWLDHRDTAQAMAGHTHQHGADNNPAREDGVTRAQRSQLYFSSLDGTVAPKGIARGVCYCCKTALTTDADGTIYAAWRHVYAGNMRDIAFTVSRDGGRSFSEPVRVSEDTWQLDGCPENGPALSIDESKRIHVIWPTLVRDGNSETLKLFHASSSDGRTFSARAALPTTGAAYHPQQVVTPDGSLIAAWDEMQSGQRRVVAARGRLDAGGEVRFTQVPLGDAAAGWYPALAVTTDHVVIAWAQRGEPSSQLAVTFVPF